MTEQHEPRDWFTRGVFPSCSCGVAPQDNLKLIAHWKENGVAWHDDHGQLVRTEVRTWTDATQAQLDKAETHGIEYALAEIGNGNEGPQEGPLSGEWADGLTPRMVAENVGYYEGLSAHGEAYYENETALADAWETGYNDTWANHLENLPIKQWVVTYTSMTIDARTASEAIERAGDSHGGGNWEAEEVTL